MSEFDRFYRTLGYCFNNPELLKEALTHRSAGSRNNERLEFLGDGILNFIIAAELYHRYPVAAEGELSRLRASLVKGDALAEIASRLQLGEWLYLGAGELKSGGYRRASILADAMEAVFGAVYLDGGFEQCRQLLLHVYSDALVSLPDVSELKDPKTRLQELLQSRQLPLPEYEVIAVTGEAHNQVFKVLCKVTGVDGETVGAGSSRRKAEQDSAHKVLEILVNNPRNGS